MLEIGQIVGLTGQIKWSNGQIKHLIRQIGVANNMISPDIDAFGVYRHLNSHLLSTFMKILSTF